MAVKKRVAKKRVAKKRVGTSTRKKSMATGETPNKRLKARRVKNVKKGYYPNPIIELFHVKIINGNKTYYFDGSVGCSDKRNAAMYNSQAAAKRIAQQISDTVRDSAQVFVEGTILKKK